MRGRQAPLDDRVPCVDEPRLAPGRAIGGPRPHLEPLASKVGGHLCVRAMQLLRDGSA
jgi:hypothetical protein